MPVLQFQATFERSKGVVASALLVVMLAACGGVATTSSGVTTTSSGVTTTSGQQLERQHQQARDALARWADAVAAAGDQQRFVIVGDATGQIGAWETEVGSNNKSALMSGKVVAVVALADEVPAAVEVHWKDRSVETLPTISAAQALKELQASGDQLCTECDALKVTAAELTVVQIQTSRGPATVPAWEFSLEGTSVHVTRVAIAAQAKVSVSPPPWDPNDTPMGLSIDSASGTRRSRQLTVSFLGAPFPGSQPCGADYEAEAVESRTAVVVIVIEHNNTTPRVCEAVGAGRSATVQLAAPLGDRAVLEVKEGLPVPVTLLP